MPDEDKIYGHCCFTFYRAVEQFHSAMVYQSQSKKILSVSSSSYRHAGTSLAGPTVAGPFFSPTFTLCAFSFPDWIQDQLWM